MTSDRPRSGQYDSASLRALHSELDVLLRPPAKSRCPLNKLAKATASQVFDRACLELEQRGWNESQIARALQITPQYVQDLRAGRRNVLGWHLLALPTHGRGVAARGVLDGPDFAECEDPPSWVSKAG